MAGFVLPFFSTETDVKGFVQAREQLTPTDNVAKIMMHQPQRLVSISDDIPLIRPHSEVFHLLCLMMCAEKISRLHAGLQREGRVMVDLDSASSSSRTVASI